MFPTRPHVRLLLNSRSGRHARHRVDKAVDRLRAAGWACDVLEPASVEETRALGADPGGYDATILSGGDGTLAAFLQDAPFEKTVVGLLPGGTANVVARDLDLPLDPLGAAEVLLRRRARPMDVGEARWPDGSRRRFVLSCSTGVVAEAVARVSPRLKRFSGQAAYAASFMESMRSNHEVEIAIDDERWRGALAVALLTRHYAGGFIPAPDSNRGDGRFDVFLLDGSFASYASFLAGRARRFLPLSRFFTHTRVAALALASRGPLELDGDPASDSPVALAIVGSVQILGG